MARGIAIVSLLIVALMPGSLLAAESNKEGNKPQYIQLKAPIVVNFGPYSRRSKFLQAKVSLRVENDDDAIDVSYHEAPIRHNLIMLFSSLPADSVLTPRDIEKLRQKALKITQETIHERARGAEITDLLFTSFITQ